MGFNSAFKGLNNKILNLLHIQCDKFLSKFTNTPVIIQPIQEILGIELYLNFTTAYVPAEHTEYGLHLS